NLLSYPRMPGPDSPLTPEPALSRKEKEQLLRKMYNLPHWIAIIRLFAYQSLAMDKARGEIKPIAEEFGKEKTAEACEVLVEIFTEGKEPFARLKSHIRRMAFMILGPEPTLAAPAIASAPEPESASEPVRPPEKKKRRSRTAATAPPPAAVKAEPTASNNRSAIMQQYQAAKEKHPDMVLL